MQLPLTAAAAGFTMMLLPTLILRWLARTSTISRSPATPQKPFLRLNIQNEINIAIFSDLHYGEEEDGWGIDQDVNSTRVMQNFLASEVPDFVVLSPSHLFP